MFYYISRWQCLLRISRFVRSIEYTSQSKPKRNKPSRIERRQWNCIHLVFTIVFVIFFHILPLVFSALHLFAFVSSWHFIFSIRFARRELYHIVVEWSLFTPSNTFISNNEKYFTCHSYLWQTFLIHRILFDGTKFYAKNAIW